MFVSGGQFDIYWHCISETSSLPPWRICEIHSPPSADHAQWTCHTTTAGLRIALNRPERYILSIHSSIIDLYRHLSDVICNCDYMWCRLISGKSLFLLFHRHLDKNRQSEEQGLLPQLRWWSPREVLQLFVRSLPAGVVIFQSYFMYRL